LVKKIIVKSPYYGGKKKKKNLQPANKQTTFLPFRDRCCPGTTESPIDLPEMPVGPALAQHKKPSVLFLVRGYYKKGCPQTTDWIACRPAPRLARNPRRLALAQGKVISAFSSYIPIFENR
jgi:hypothetical protein